MRMFKQVKSALIWYYLFRFRRRVSIIILLLLFAFFANSIYGDVVNYLTLTKQLYLLKYALLTKWVIILGSLFAVIYSIISLFKNIGKKKTPVDKKKLPITPMMSPQEQRLREKPQLRSRADQLIARKAEEKRRKNNSLN
ncbi:hypothetical protein A6A19_02960 [Actinobacillus delphinicola]|uniref:hypothetical protein n=1 Tax=Actinobacillus delphinicola TaxID=51161 RepID=UPI0024416358|nr:hypothetical protein [Actinobacillus delphinicola]MDG6896985.1 hypothetical protein [Actinobacillus delphinicola]